MTEIIALQRKRYYPSLDGLRGLAAIAVLLYHAFYQDDRSLIPRGHLAVDLFFVLSGFVVQEAYGHEETKVRFFAEQRFIRLYPMLICSAIFSYFCSRGQQGALGLAFLQAMPIPIPVFNHHDLYPLNGAIWSMFSECLINVAFIVALRKRSNSMLAVISFSALIPLVFLAAQNHTFNIGWNTATFLGGPLRIAFAFPIGMLISRMNAGDRLPRIKFEYLSVMLCFFFAVPHLSHGDFVVEVLLAVIAVPFLCALGAASTAGTSMTRFCTHLALLSYPLYLLHVPTLRLLDNWSTGSLTERMAAACAGLAVGAIAAWGIDKPLRRQIAAFVRRSTGEPVRDR